MSIDIEHDDLTDLYHQIERQLEIRNTTASVSYSSPVNFGESMASPRHRWFPYKEGFSPSFITNFLKNCESRHGCIVDPFGGVGTTAIVASQSGFRAFSYDVSTLASFIARTKSLNLSPDEMRILNGQVDAFQASPLASAAPSPGNRTVINYFDPSMLDALLRVKQFALSQANRKLRDLFLLAFLALIEEFSTHRRAGNGVKKKTRLTYSTARIGAIDQVKRRTVQLLDTFIADMRSTALPIPPVIISKSSLEQGCFDECGTIAGVLTSPPYANCFDYSKIYMRELWLGGFFETLDDQRAFRESSVRSHVHATWQPRHEGLGSEIVENVIVDKLRKMDLWSPKLPSMLTGYFQDIGKLLVGLRPHLSRHASLGFVVGNSFYGGVPVATDLLLSETARQLGYSTTSVDICRGIIPSSQQYMKIEDKYFMRESLVTLRKSNFDL